MRFLNPVFLLCAAMAAMPAAAGVAEPDLRHEESFSLARTLAHLWSYEIPEDRWNAFGQATYISSYKDAFHARYTNLNGSPNSLLPGHEQSFTGTATLYLGLKAWDGGEVYLAPEMVSETPLSGLHGLGGSIQNFELQKNGSVTPTIYRSRFFLRQTWSLGGARSEVQSSPLQLAGSTDTERLVITAGNLSVIDIFDKNAFAGDLRQQFFNMAFLSYAAYDFAADARGYSWGLTGEYYADDWAFRFGRFIAPRLPNQLQLDFRILKHYGDQAELEHQHLLFGQPGKLRFLAYRNDERMGGWDDAMAALRSDPAKNAASCPGFSYNSANDAAPDLCWVRKSRVKMGAGINLEQNITSELGVFFRGMVSDGKTEVYSYTSSDRSLAVGALLKGSSWQREKDTLGLSYAQSWISKSHAAFLNLGGVDGFIGDGRIRYKPEQVVDFFYNLNLTQFLWFTLDYQHIVNPAYNADRGPVNVYGGRAHLEF